MLQAASKRVAALKAGLASLLLVASASLAAQAGTPADCPLPDTLAAQIDDWAVDRGLLSRLYRHQLAAEDALTPERFLNEVVEDALLATHALNNDGDAAWGEETRVGFPLTVKFEDQRISLARQLLMPRLQAWTRARFGDSTELPVQRRIQIPAELEKALRSDLPFQDILPADQLARLDSVPAAQLDWPGAAPAMLSLAEAWRRTNVQERHDLIRGDLERLSGVAERWAQGQVVDAWLAQDESLSASERQFFAELPKRRWLATTARKRLGVLEVMHESNPALTARAAQVSEAEARRYYEALVRGSQISRNSRINPKTPEFQRIAEVDAEYLSLADEPAAQAAHDAIRAGLSFADAAARFESTGPIHQTLRRTDDMGWLHATAFALPEGTLSKPIRMPVQAGEDPDQRRWVLMRVLRKQTEWMPADSPSIHYQASLAIAREALQADYRRLLKRLRSESALCVRQDWLIDTP